MFHHRLKRLVCLALTAYWAGSGVGECLPAGMAGPRYSIRSWQVENGLPGNTITTLLPSQNGYLWIATLAGLVRFDGYRFTVFDNERNPQLKNGRITALYEDADGALWVGHETGDVTLVRHGVFESVPLPKEWQEDVIASIGRDGAGDVWVESRQGRLARLRDGKVIPPVPNVASTYGLAAMAVDAAGKLWVWRGGALGYLTNGEAAVVPNPPGEATNFVQGFSAARGGGLWVVRGGRLFRYIHDAWLPEPLPATGLENAIGVTEAGSGLVIVRTANRGLWLVEPGRSAVNLTRATGLGSDWAGCACEDHEGNIWVGSAGGGLNRLRRARFEVSEPPNRWNGMPVLALGLARDNTLWVGTEGSGLFHRDAQGDWLQLGSAEGVNDRYVWSVLPDREGKIWAGTWSGWLLSGGGPRFAPAPGYAQNQAPIFALFEDQAGGLWVGTHSGLLHYAGGRTERFGLEQGVRAADVRAIAQAPDGSIWFGMLGGGLGRLKDGQLRQFGRGDGLANDFVLCLHFDAAGALWMGTVGGGLCRLKAGGFVKIGSREGLPNNTISWIQEDGLGSYWLSSAGGIFQVPEEQLNKCADGLAAQADFISYGVADGLESTDCSGGFQPAGGRSADGRLWFSTRRTVVSLEPTRLQKNSVPPPVFIEQALADDQPLPEGNPPAPKRAPRENIDPISERKPGTEWRVPAGTQRLEFRFTALSFSNPEFVRFKYRLDKLDPDWMEGDPARKVIYGHVPPGHYRFQVTACNNDGLWNYRGAELRFYVQPRFWQTWWFQTIAYGSGAGAVVGLVLADARRRHRRRLSEFEREHAIEFERSRIAKDMHDDLGASLNRISLLSQTAGVGLEESSPTAQYLRQIYVGVRELTRGLDEIVWAVNPRHDTLESLLNYLTRFTFEFLRGANIRARINMPVQVPDWRIRSEVRHNVFLALKETLNNCVKHSGGSEVRVTLQLATEAFELSIEDNGRGFEVAKIEAPPPGGDRFAPGNGLANIRSRLEAIGGAVQITSAGGQGTRVVFSVPVVQE